MGRLCSIRCTCAVALAVAAGACALPAAALADGAEAPSLSCALAGAETDYLDEASAEPARIPEALLELQVPSERSVLVARLLAVASSQAGITDGYRYQNAAIERGATFNDMGPCTAYVWWCFEQAGLSSCFMDGAATTYPHEVRDWYAAHGSFAPKGDYVPVPGDLWLTDNPTGRPFPEASATHCGIVDHVDGDTIYVWEHVNGYVHLVAETADHETLVGYAQPTIQEG